MIQMHLRFRWDAFAALAERVCIEVTLRRAVPPQLNSLLIPTVSARLLFRAN
jgi:hypothetical protein